MSDTPASLRWQATTLDRRAGEVSDLAGVLARHHEDLADRLRPVIDKHRSDVWHSDAASRSRRTLVQGGTGYLTHARDELFGVISELRRHATSLEDEAASLRRRAASIEAQELAQFEADMIARLGLTELVTPPSAGAGVRYF